MQFIDLAAQRKRIEGELYRAINDVVVSGKYILGPQVTEFEQKLAQYLGVKHVIACANGTDALLMPLMANKIGPGDAVFCPSFTFAATAEVVALVGAEPVFVDVDPSSYNIDCEHLAQSIAMVKKEGRLKARAVIPVDLFGLAADYQAIHDIASVENLVVIEDAAQSIGGKRDERMCGSFGDVASTSFYPAKPLGCYGDGGAMMTNDSELAETLRSLLFHGKGATQYDNIRIGMNSRLDTIQAAILLQKLSILEEEMEKRRQIGDIYTAGLRNVAQVPELGQNIRSAYAQYTVKVEKRDQLREYLTQKNIPSVIYYAKPLHLQSAYRGFQQGPGGLPNSEMLAGCVISLPMHPYLSAHDQQLVIDAITSFYR